MLFTLLMVVYVVLAIFMIGFILIQRGAGAAAGSGFGAGASATVFGARGASSFLTKSTKWMAIAFFALTLGLAMYVQRTGLTSQRASLSDDLGVMSGVQQTPATPAPATGDVPQAPETNASQSAPAGDVPAVPEAQPAEGAEAAPAVEEPAEQDDE